MKEQDVLYVNDLRVSRDDPSRAVVIGTIRYISENPPYTNIYLDTGYQVTIKGKE
jgi:hypothetical protein